MSPLAVTIASTGRRYVLRHGAITVTVTVASDLDSSLTLPELAECLIEAVTLGPLVPDPRSPRPRAPNPAMAPDG